VTEQTFIRLTNDSFLHPDFSKTATIEWLHPETSKLVYSHLFKRFSLFGLHQPHACGVGAYLLIHQHLVVCFAMKELSSFGGVWRRTKLYEPIGSVGPEEEQLKDVLWIQSQNGYFIDIRYQHGATSHLKMKSFAGIGSFDESSCHFTWDRKFDFRAPGAPDIGLMRLLQGSSSDPLQLEEDGVLPGDDYREIWDRLSGSVSSSDVTARAVQRSCQGDVMRQGLFLRRLVRHYHIARIPSRCRYGGCGPEASL